MAEDESGPGRITAVWCGGCRQRMQRVRLVAIVQRYGTTDTPHSLYECSTPDCGTSLIVEDT